MGFIHLTEEERDQIYALLRQGKSSRAIAKELDRHHSTIARERLRNKGERGYRPEQAIENIRKGNPRRALSAASTMSLRA